MSALVMDFPTFLVFVLAFVAVYRLVKPRLFGSGTAPPPPPPPSQRSAKPYELPASVAEAEERVVGQVGALWLYPVKSAPGVEVQSAVLGPRGFVGDRQLMLVREAGPDDDPGEPLSFVSLRNVPELARLRVRLEADGTVVLAARTAEAELRVGPSEGLARPAVRCRLWDEEVACSPVGPAADAWCSRALGRPLRLVRVGPPFARDVPPERRDPAVSAATSLADGYPYLATFGASLAAVAERAEQPVDVRRFRPNLEVRGPGAAFAEDAFAELRVGQRALFRNLKCCSRCKVPRLALETGQESADGQPTRALQELGHFCGDEAYFGINLAHLAGAEGAVVRVGDPVVLTRSYPHSILPK